MDQTLWAKAHGAATHFPVALVPVSALFDSAALAFRARPVTRDLRAVGYWTILLAALGTVPAVVSGIVLTRGGVLGHGAMRLHHLFVWPSFALIVGLASWRLAVGPEPSLRALGVYLGCAVLTTALIGLAGYWGGEVLLAQ